MTLAQIWKNEGLSEGIQLGMEKTLAVYDLLSSGKSIEEMEKMTGLSQKQVLEIKRHLPQ